MNPKFPRSYAFAPGGGYDYKGKYLVTLKEQFNQVSNDGFYLLRYEAQRRFAGLQLDLAENDGVYLGCGTGGRAENPEVSTGRSWHQVVPFPSTNLTAHAIDTVGLPTHDKAWAAMQKKLNKYGFASFAKGTTQFNYTGVPANVKNDPPHIQPYELPYGRSASNIPLPHLNVWEINPRYDIAHPSFNWDDPLPSTEEDFEVTAAEMEQIARMTAKYVWEYELIDYVGRERQRNNGEDETATQWSGGLLPGAHYNAFKANVQTEG